MAVETKGRTAFVTGSTGLLGSHLVPRLRERGWLVRALARSAAKAAEVFAGDEGVEVVVGDLEGIAGFAPRLRGCDALFHLAARYREHRPGDDDGAALEATNVAATTALLEASHRGGVRDVVHVSSAGVVDLSREGTPLDESAPFDEAANNPYFRSKVHAERAVDAFLEAHPDTRIVVVRPSLMMGPGDRGPTPAGRFVQAYLAGAMPAVLPGRMVVVDVRDVANAIAMAADEGASGERFFLGGEAHELADIVGLLEEASGVPAPRKRPPYPVAWVALTVAKWLGKPTPVGPGDLKRMQTMRAPDAGKAEQRLGFERRALAETIRDTVRWFESSVPVAAT